MKIHLIAAHILKNVPNPIRIFSGKNRSMADFHPGDLFIGADGYFYITSSFNSLQGFCAFHKPDDTGHIIFNEFNPDFERRTFSHIIPDNAGNMHLSATCGNGAIFDTIPANAGFSCQNFSVKYDGNFKARWLLCAN